MRPQGSTITDHMQRYQNQDGLNRRIGELRAELEGANPAELAGRAGATLVGSELTLALMGRPLIITLPDLEVLALPERKVVSLTNCALVLTYLTTTNGAPLAGRWISFRELPHGGFYHQAFQGYTGHEITKCFGDDLPALEQAALCLGGQRESLGDAAFSFQALPWARLALVYWLGDEDFSSSAQVLFDAAAGHHLPTDGYALLGSMLTRRLISQHRNSGAASVD